MEPREISNFFRAICFMSFLKDRFYAFPQKEDKEEIKKYIDAVLASTNLGAFSSEVKNRYGVIDSYGNNIELVATTYSENDNKYINFVANVKYEEEVIFSYTITVIPEDFGKLFSWLDDEVKDQQIERSVCKNQQDAINGNIYAILKNSLSKQGDDDVRIAVLDSIISKLVSVLKADKDNTQPYSGMISHTVSTKIEDNFNIILYIIIETQAYDINGHAENANIVIIPGIKVKEEEIAEGEPIFIGSTSIEKLSNLCSALLG